MVWYGKELYSIVWYGMVWYGIISYIMVLYGIQYSKVWYSNHENRIFSNEIENKMNVKLLYMNHS